MEFPVGWRSFSGLTTVQAGSDEQRPRLIRTVLPDKLTAVTAAQAISAALVGRLKTGKGQHVHLSMLDAVLAFLWASDMGAQTYVGETVSPRTAASFIDLIYETKNGFMTAAVMTNKEWAALTRALQRPGWLEDPRFATPAARDQQIAASGILLESDHPVAGRLRQTRTAARFATPTVIRHGAPRLGQHSAEVLADLGLSAADIAALRRQGVVGPE